MKRPLALIGFSYFLTLFSLNYIPENKVIIVAGVIFVMLLISISVKKIREKKFFGTAFLSCFVAIISYTINYNLNVKPVYQLDGKDVEISGVVCDIPYKKNHKYNYVIKVDKIDNKNIKPFKIILSSNSALESDICDTFIGNVHVCSIQDDTMFNYKMYCKSQNIYAQAFFYEYMKNSSSPPKNKTINYYILNTRKNFLYNFRKIFTNEISSVINSIFLGEKNDIPHKIKINFDKIGIYHILTTSGIQISLLSQSVLWILRKIKINNKLSHLIATISVFILEIFTGFSPAATKSCTITIIYLLGIVISRKSDKLNSLGISVLLMCLINPNYACSSGLLLSVFSTLGTILLYKPIKNRFQINIESKFLNKIIDYIISNISLSISVIIFTLPIVMMYYGKISLISIISNIIIYPFALLIIFGAFFVNVLSCLQIPNYFINPYAVICGLSAKIIIWISDLFSKLPFSSIETDYGICYLCLSCIIILFIVSLYLKNLKNSIKTSCLISINLILISAFSYQIQNKNTTLISMAPCGDGIAMVISQNRHHAVFLQLKENTNIENIQNYFSKWNIYRPDYMYISSTDSTKKPVIKDIIKDYNPQNIISYIKENVIDEDYLKELPQDMKIVYFKNNIVSEFWNKMSSEIIQKDNKIFIKINSPYGSFLVFPNGGNVNLLPKSWNKCDFLILSGIPFDCQKIKSKNIIFSTDQNRTKIGIYKLTNYNSSLYSLAYQGALYINLYEKEKYQIGRLK